MFSFCYNLFLHGFAAVHLPKLLIREKKRLDGADHFRPMASYFSRDLPRFEAKGRFVVWVHAVSMGEVKAIAPLIERLRQEHDEICIVFSTVTSTGQEEVKRSLKMVDHTIYLPFDLPYLIQPLVKKIKPNLVVLCETDFWFNFLTQVKKQGGKVIVVNGKMSQRTSRRLASLPEVARHLLMGIDNFCLQDEIYRERFERLGIPPSRLRVTGNLKYDASPKKMTAAQKKKLSERLRLNGGRVITIGSTHEPEEEELLRELAPTIEGGVKVLVVPRHPERFNQVFDHLKSGAWRVGRYSEPDSIDEKTQVIVIDTMGLLGHCYQLSDLAIVAGSFSSRVGGHNLLEPLWFGVPILFGPVVHQQESMAQLVLSHHAGIQIKSDQLFDSVDKLLCSEEEYQRLVDGSKELLEGIRGALDATWLVLNDYVHAYTYQA